MKNDDGYFYSQSWNKCTHTHTPINARARTHTLFLRKPDLSRPHLHSFSVLLSSAWFRALVWSYNQLNRRRRTLNPGPSFCYTIYASAFWWRTRGWVKQRVEQNKSSPFASFRAITRMHVLEHRHKRKKNLKFRVMEAFGCGKKIWQCFIIIGDKPCPLQKGTRKGALPNSWGIVWRDVE